MNALSQSISLMPEYAARLGGQAVPPSSFTLDPLALDTWDAQIVSHPQATIFHTAAWARVLHDTYRHRPWYLGRIEAGRVSNLWPIMEVESVLTGKRGVALPFTDFCEPLAIDKSAAARNWELAIELGRERGWKYFECRGAHGVPAGARPALSYYGHELDLTIPESDLFAGLEAEVRRAIRKAQVEAIDIEIKTDIASVQAFYTLHCLTRQRHGVPPQPCRFFVNIQRHVLARGLGCVLQARWRGEVVASGIFFQFGTHAVYKFGASNRDFQSLRPNNLLMWEAIKWHAARGFATLHFGRTSLANEGLRRFKLGFGCREWHMENFRYDFRKGNFVTTVDRTESGLRKVFRRLPRTWLRASGVMLYPHLD